MKLVTRNCELISTSRADNQATEGSSEPTEPGETVGVYAGHTVVDASNSTERSAAVTTDSLAPKKCMRCQLWIMSPKITSQVVERFVRPW